MQKILIVKIPRISKISNILKIMKLPKILNIFNIMRNRITDYVTDYGLLRITTVSRITGLRIILRPVKIQKCPDFICLTFPYQSSYPKHEFPFNEKFWKPVLGPKLQLSFFIFLIYFTNFVRTYVTQFKSGQSIKFGILPTAIAGLIRIRFSFFIWFF